MPELRIAVFASSREGIADIYKGAARSLGTQIGKSGSRLVFGGSNCGLMRIVATAAFEAGAKVSAIIPESILKSHGVFGNCEDVIVSADLRDRKCRMIHNSAGVICLPGGFGSLDEVTEVLALKQLGDYDKPVILINTNDFFSPFDQCIKRMIAEGFIKNKHATNYFLTESADEAVSLILDYASDNKI